MPPRRREQEPVGERATLESFLDDYREIVIRKVGGLSEADARRRLVPSLTTVGGLIKHLRWAEYGWFDQLLQERVPDNRRPHERSGEFEFLPDESLAMFVTDYRVQCEQSRRIAAQFPLGHAVPHRRLGRVSLRWIYVHMIEETARHAGQLDILREQLDGRVGDDAERSDEKERRRSTASATMQSEAMRRSDADKPRRRRCRAKR